MGNSFGKIFRITSFGESHGKSIGVVVDGLPPDINLDLEFIQRELNRRSPGQSEIVTQRKENDEVEIISGIFEGKSVGTPITLVIQNQDQRSNDYGHISDKFRPSHADFTYHSKYGTRDYRGGGRSSARETAARVAAGAVAKLALNQLGIGINGYVSRIGDLKCKSYQNYDLSTSENNIVRCPDQELAAEMISLVKEVKKDGDSIGGVVSCIINNTPIGLGEPVFDKFHAELGKAMLSINAAKGFQYGSGFDGVNMRGSEHNDAFYRDGDKTKTQTNFSGGVQGGITNGEDIYFDVAFKPVATIMKDQSSVDEAGNEVTIKGKGRHDPCVVPRAVPIVEAMAAIVTLDFYLRHQRLNLGN